MSEIHYLISDASRKVDVEAHVLRYWEDELELDIPRNEMGHRYYTELHIKMFRQIKELKEKGYQLKAIKNVLKAMMDNDSTLPLPPETLLLPEKTEPDTAAAIPPEKLEVFQNIMNSIIGHALDYNNEKLSQDISCIVNERVTRELDYLMRISDEKEDERFKQLDETLRAYQNGERGHAEAAAAKVPFKIPFFNLKKKKKIKGLPH